MSRVSLRSDELLLPNDGVEKVDYEEAMGSHCDSVEQRWLVRKSSNPLFVKIESAFYLLLQMLSPKNAPESRVVVDKNNESVGTAWRSYEDDRSFELSGVHPITLMLNGFAELLSTLLFLNQTLGDQLYWMKVSGEFEETVFLKIGSFNTTLSDATSFPAETLFLNFRALAKSDDDEARIARLFEFPEFKKESFLTMLRIVLLPRDFFKTTFSSDEDLEERFFGRKIDLEEKLYRDKDYGEVFLSLSQCELAEFILKILPDYFLINSKIADPRSKNEVKEYLFNRYLIVLQKFISYKAQMLKKKLYEHVNHFSQSTLFLALDKQQCSLPLLNSALRNVCFDLSEKISSVSLSMITLNEFDKKFSILQHVLSNFHVSDSFSELRKLSIFLHENLKLSEFILIGCVNVVEARSSIPMGERGFLVDDFVQDFEAWVKRSWNALDFKVDILNKSLILSIFDAIVEIKKEDVNTPIAVEKIEIQKNLLIRATTPESFYGVLLEMMHLADPALLEFRQLFFKRLLEYCWHESAITEALNHMMNFEVPADAYVDYLNTLFLPSFGEKEVNIFFLEIGKSVGDTEEDWSAPFLYASQERQLHQQGPRFPAFFTSFNSADRKAMQAEWVDVAKELPHTVAERLGAINKEKTIAVAQSVAGSTVAAVRYVASWIPTYKK